MSLTLLDSVSPSRKRHHASSQIRIILQPQHQASKKIASKSAVILTSTPFPILDAFVSNERVAPRSRGKKTNKHQPDFTSGTNHGGLVYSYSNACHPSIHCTGNESYVCMHPTSKKKITNPRSWNPNHGTPMAIHPCRIA